MDQDRELLSFVHKNAAMGTVTIPKVLELAQSPGLRQTLADQLTEYREIADRAEEAIRRRGGEPKGPGPVSEAMSTAMLRAKTALNKSSSHLAEMMIRGSAMGTVQMTRRLRQCAGGADRGTVELARRLLRAEEQNIQQLKAYL